MAHQCSFISRCVDESVLQDQHLSLTVETEQASLERAWDLKERENTLGAKQQRLDATCAGVVPYALQLEYRPDPLPNTVAGCR